MKRTYAVDVTIAQTFTLSRVVYVKASDADEALDKATDYAKSQINTEANKFNTIAQNTEYDARIAVVGVDNQPDVEGE
ncbi:hypothetical protein EBZ38_03965 [bacterium]|nr:hypothetical protein [bacterium]